MQRTILALLALLTLVAAPVAAAQDNSTGDSDAPDNVNVDIGFEDENAEESAGFAGFSTTVVIIMVVLAVLVIALVVAMANRP